MDYFRVRALKGFRTSLVNKSNPGKVEQAAFGWYRGDLSRNVPVGGCGLIHCHVRCAGPVSHPETPSKCPVGRRL